MFEFQKKTTPITNIAFMSIMAAINVVFALLMAFIPYIIAILILILPLTSVLVALYCQKRYYPLYIIATLGLCFISAIWDPSITLFYILPSMITGFIFAIFVTLKLPSIYLILVPSIIQLLASYGGIYFTKLLTNVNIIASIQSLLALQDFDLFNVMVPSFIFAICLIQSIFSYMIIKDELPKFGYVINENSKIFIVDIVSIFILLIATLLFGIFNILNFAYLSMCLTTVLAIELCLKTCLEKSILMIVLNAVSLAVTFVIFLITYQYLKNGTALLIFNVFYLLTTSLAIINKYLLNKNGEDKIENESK